MCFGGRIATEVRPSRVDTLEEFWIEQALRESLAGDEVANADAGDQGQGAKAEAQEAELCELTFMSLAGNKLAVLLCDPEETVVGVKRRIANHCSIPIAEQRLVHGGERLQDFETLQMCGISAGASILQCVRVRLSGVARHLEAQGSSSDPEKAVLASQAELIESVMQSEHALSERSRPHASDVLRAISQRHRSELINWMLRAFDVMHFGDDFLHSVVLTLDRYYARCATPLEVQNLQPVLLAAVCTEMKLAGDHWPTFRMHQGLRALCHGRVSLAAILQTEFEVLSRLSFVVGVPTPVTFLRELGLRVRETGSEREQEAGKEAVEVALFLLELAFFEPVEEYGGTHALLAAGALSAALRALEEKYQGEELCGPERRQQLFEDLALYGQDRLGCVEEETQVLDCEERLLELWLARATGRGGCPWADFYGSVEAKFTARGVNVSDRGRGGMLLVEAALARCRQARADE